jgi:hypothetical protein
MLTIRGKNRNKHIGDKEIKTERNATLSEADYSGGNAVFR